MKTAYIWKANSLQLSTFQAVNPSHIFPSLTGQMTWAGCSCLDLRCPPLICAHSVTKFPICLSVTTLLGKDKDQETLIEMFQAEDSPLGTSDNAVVKVTVPCSDAVCIGKLRHAVSLNVKGS